MSLYGRLNGERVDGFGVFGAVVVADVAVVTAVGVVAVAVVVVVGGEEGRNEADDGGCC